MTSRLHITAGYKNNRTYLKHSFCEQPFKLANITEEKMGSLLRLMIMSSSPGILDGDNYSIEISIEENAKVNITTQAYQRLFSMHKKANQCMNVHLHNNGSLYFLPHPNVPHAASGFLSVNNIYLHKNHDLAWSEIITCGRKLSGEEFKFTRYHNITNIYLCNKLVIKENVLLEPLKNDVPGLGQLEGFTHQSTFLFINDHADIKKIAEACTGLLSGIEDIIFGVSALPVNGLICRLLGRKSEKLFNCNNDLALLIQRSLHLDEKIEQDVISHRTAS